MIVSQCRWYDWVTLKLQFLRHSSIIVANKLFRVEIFFGNKLTASQRRFQLLNCEFKYNENFETSVAKP
jgi:hypothetical protein